MNKHVKTLFLDWIENGTSKREEIEDHLRECEDCRSYYQKMFQLLDPGVVSDFPRLVPNPFIPTRVVAMEAKQRQAKSEQLAFTIRLSLNGVAVILAMVVGIMLGKTLSHQSPQRYTTDEITAMYQNAISPQDFSTQLESLYNELGGEPQ